MGRWTITAGCLALLACVGAALAGGLRLDGYSHALHPLGLLGAERIPGAAGFNVAGFLVPGLLAAAVALGAYRALPATAGWLPRIGARMLLVSALAFAAQGLFPLQLDDIDGPGSGLHAGAWLAWWVAFVAGAPLLAAGMRRLVPVTAAAACVLLAAMFIPPALLDAPYAQRIGLGAWLLWLAVVPWLARTGVARDQAIPAR